MIKIDSQWDDNFLLRRLQTGRLNLEGIPRETMQQVGQIWKEQAQAESPVKSGDLKKSWSYRTRAIGNDQVEMELRNSDPNASYKLYRTRRHVITARGRALSNGQFAFKRVNHPGTRGTNVFKILRGDVSLNNETAAMFESALKKLADKL